MELTLTAPALVFPAISLLLLAYTNRFLTLAELVRRLHAEHSVAPNPRVDRQIESLRRRIRIIRWMTGLGIASFLLCILTMFLLFLGVRDTAGILFGGAMVALIGSLSASAWEIKLLMSTLELQLADIESDRLD